MINRLIPITLTFCLGLVTSAFANDAAEAMAQIQKMSDAMNNKSYSGDFVYLHGTQLESMSIQHVQTANGLKERLFSLNGEAREVFRDDENLTCVWPGSQKVILDKSKQLSFSPLWIPDDVARLAKFYEFKIEGMGRVANRMGKIVFIQPKDNLRYGMRIWVDDAEGYLLKSVLLNSNNEVLEQVMFTQINHIENPELVAMNLAPKSLDNFSIVSSHTSLQENRMMPDSAWKMEKLPLGFWQESAYKKPTKSGNDYVHHMIFTDGLASLSLFIEKQSKDSLMGSSSMGAINAYGIIVNGYAVTAVGEVPQQTVKHLVSSIYYE